MILLLCFLSQQLYAQQILSDWETARTSETVELQYRWLKLGDTLKTRELRSIFTVNASIDAIVTQLSTASDFESWSARIKKCETYEKSDDGWIMYSYFDIPKPFKQRDLVARYSFHTEGSKTIINVEAIPEYLPELKKVHRMKNYSGYWILEQNGKHKTDVKFHSTSFSKPVLPRFIMDPIIQRMLIRSFEKLINLSENETLAQN